MALVICCPCGLPLECENIDLVVDLSCLRCGRTLELELTDEQGTHRRAVLTIMDGPIWKGEQFVMPIGQSLTIGTAANGWLALEDDGIAEQHCRLRVSDKGYVVIEDLDTESGTWIENARIAKGKLFPAQSFRVGGFRFRLDYRSVLGQQQPAVSIADGPVAAIALNRPFERLKQDDAWLEHLHRRRYVYARSILTIFAWLAGGYHALHLRFDAAIPWEGYWAVIIGGLIIAALLWTTRLVALVHRYAKYAGVATLVLLAFLDITFWKIPISSIPPLVLAAAVSMSITREPGAAGILTAATLAIGAVAMLAIMILQVAMPLIPA